MRSITLPTFGKLIGILALAFAAGCGSEIVPATQHPVNQPQNVQIYQDAPKKYEILGQVEDVIPVGYTWDANGNANEEFDRLKAKAAQLGANGVLLTIDRSLYDVQAGAGYYGTQYEVAIRNNPKTAVAIAIYVIEK